MRGLAATTLAAVVGPTTTAIDAPALGDSSGTKTKSRLAMQFRIAHHLVDVPAADHPQTHNTRGGNEAILP